MPILAALELFLVAYVEEAAEVSIYMNTMELCQKMADLMMDKPIGEAFADFCAKSRGLKNSDGSYVIKAADYEPGATWAKNFLKHSLESGRRGEGRAASKRDRGAARTNP
jgi:hypothetical protein